ncbi:MAG: MarR family winged helix-turn-helix transcriptional regulator [Parvibaculales bacterium]
MSHSTDKNAPDLTHAIELMFFAYRDFVADPDKLLQTENLGRAHHRAMHFIGRQPGLSVAQLLQILGITKQSLSRVLNDLLNKGFVKQNISNKDRRKRLLTLTPTGQAFLDALIAPQHERFQLAMKKCDTETLEAWQKFMLHLLNSDHLPEILKRFEQIKVESETDR